MISLTHVVSGEQLATDLCTDEEELALCLAYIGKQLNENKRLYDDLQEMVCELNVVTDIKLLASKLGSM